MGENLISQNNWKSSQERDLEMDTSSAIRKKIQQAQEDAHNTSRHKAATVAENISSLGELESENGMNGEHTSSVETKQEKSANHINKVPTPPADRREERPRNKKKTDEKSPEVSDKPAEKAERKKRPSRENEDNQRESVLSQIVDSNDPVLYKGAIRDLNTPGTGAWFLDDKSDTSPGSTVRIIYKEPDGSVTDEKQVSWPEITPTYGTAQEYTEALDTIVETYNKAEADNNSVYQKHLAHLLQQVSIFAMDFIKRKQRNQSETQKK